MSISFQTNVTSLIAQNNLRINTNFQSSTIQQLTSGFRINSSGDDAAGLAVANKYRSDTAELTQGVRNANDGIGAFQNIDSGLNNVSTILDRLRTLATQSASATFNGDRGTLNNEYQTLLGEVTRQASNVNLNAGGSFNSKLTVYIGGGSNAANAQVSVDLSGSSNAVDATSLKLNTSSVAGGGNSLTGNTVRLDNAAVSFLAGGTQTFTFNIVDSAGNASTAAAAVVGGAGKTGQQVVDSLNSSLKSVGISAAIGSNGQLQFSGNSAFTLGSVATGGGGSDAVSAGSTIATNSANFNIASAAFASVVGTDETLTVQNGGASYNVDLTAAGTATAASTIASFNTQVVGSGITAVLAANGTDINIQSASSFSVNQTAAAGTSGGIFSGTGTQAVTAPVAGASSTGAALAALTSLSAAVSSIGIIQGRIGAGENQLNYAVSLAQSQITNFSAAQSQIRDTDVAAQAANLTKAQVLQQSSIAALAQANSAPQALLKLLQ
jgi:flagellin